MRFGFYSSLSLAAILAIQSREANAVDSIEEDEYLKMSQLMASWDDELLNELAQFDNSDEGGYFAQVLNESGSESESNSESDSDSDVGINDLELAQQMQELNYLNALGTINAAQIQAMQSMGAMNAMGMGMGMGMMPQMGQTMAQTGMGGLSFAQTEAEEAGENDRAERDLYLAQLAVVLAHMPESDVDKVENLLAQLNAAESDEHELIFAQVGVT